ncbi:MAG TPA: hypothetical protein VKS81_07030, partial [Bacteroidota bacterium]|nr:hypothetical protein [Bacteroidota bacterium]
MKYSRLVASIALFAGAFLLVVFHPKESVRMGRQAENGRDDDAGLEKDWFMTQRSYPYADIPRHAFEKMKTTMQAKYALKNSDRKTVAAAGANWVLQGPSNIGGRITALLIHPTNENVIYAGAATGGVWKSTDQGTTWANVFNECFSIGALAFEPGNPSVIYVGTGEANPSGVDTYPGNGVWKSTDAGSTWANIGLTETGQIGKIILNPQNPNEVFVAALGLYHSQTTDRGIYKSTNKGATWSQVLYISDTTGGTDVVIDPSDSTRVLAAVWTRYRTPHESITSGSESGIYVSTDAGNTWARTVSGIPASADLGRIALTFLPSNPSIVLASAAGISGGVYWGGVYRSRDHGSTWTHVYSGTSNETQVWYNNIIVVDPSNNGLAWAGMTGMYQTIDTGATWFTASSNGAYHVDHHA